MNYLIMLTSYKGKEIVVILQKKKGVRMYHLVERRKGATYLKKVQGRDKIVHHLIWRNIP